MATVPDYEDRWIEDRIEARQKGIAEGAISGFFVGVLVGALITIIGLGLAYAT